MIYSLHPLFYKKDVFIYNKKMSNIFRNKDKINLLNEFKYYVQDCYYDFEQNKPIVVNDFKVHCMYEMPYSFYFGICIDNKMYYLAIENSFTTLATLWKSLENIIKYGYEEYYFNLEGPMENIFMFLNDCKDEIRVIYIASGWYDEIDNNNVSTLRYNYFMKADAFLFDIVVDKKKFVYEFYKELFSMFYNKETPEYHDCWGEKVIKESPFLRGYFGDLTDEYIYNSRNCLSKDYIDKEFTIRNNIDLSDVVIAKPKPCENKEEVYQRAFFHRYALLDNSISGMLKNFLMDLHHHLLKFWKLR